MMASQSWTLETSPVGGAERIAVALCFLAVVSTTSAQTHRLDLDVGMRAGYTNNVNLTKDKDSDIPVEVTAAFRYHELSPAVSALFEGRVGYVGYSMSHASDELRPDVHGNLIWRVEPERWTWTLDGSWQQLRINQTGPDSPDNTENQANIWTGPTFDVPLSHTTKLSLEARAGYQHNSEMENDSSRLGTALRLVTKKSEKTTLSGNLETQTVRHLGDISPLQPSVADFDITNVYAGYTRSDGRASTLLNIGGSFADVKGFQDRSGLFFQLDLSAEIGARSKGGLQIFSNLAYDGNAVGDGVSEPGTETPIQAVAPGLFYEKRARLYYETASKKSTLLASLFATSRDYYGGMIDESDVGGNLTLSRRLARLTEGSIFLDANWQEFDDVSLENQDYVFGVTVSRRLSRRTYADAKFWHRRRASNETSAEFDETALYFSLRRRFLP